MENQKTSRTDLIVIAIIVGALIIGGAIIYASKNSSESGPSGSGTVQESGAGTGAPTKVDIKIKESDHIRGNTSAPVTIVEFSDFQCPFCQSFHPTVQQILLDYSGDVRWVYKHFPLDSIHPQARPAAEASECVWEQGGNQSFWDFADGLFENQSRLGKSLYLELASDLGLDIGDFENCVNSRKYKDKVEADYQEGISLGVDGTPGNFINGRPAFGAFPYDDLKKMVETVLAED